MDKRLSVTVPRGDTPFASRHRIARQELGIGCRNAPRANGTELLSIGDTHYAECRIAEPHRLVEHRIEHRREIAGRGIDDLEDLGGRGLLVERLARLGDEPGVLHRDHRLGGEVLQQRDLLVGERPDFLAVGGDEAE